MNNVNIEIRVTRNELEEHAYLVVATTARQRVAQEAFRFSPEQWQDLEPSLFQPRGERERLEQERMERERLEQEKLEQERREQEQLEQERQEQVKIEQERIEIERREQEQREQNATRRRVLFIGGSIGALGLVAGGSLATFTWFNSMRKNVGPPVPVFPLTVGGKLDSEAELLSKMYVLLLQKDGFLVTDKSRLGQTDPVFNALKDRIIDIYPEFLQAGLVRLNIPTTYNKQQDFQKELGIATTLNSLAPKLTADVSIQLQQQVLDGQSAHDAAEQWLKDQGLL